MRRYPAISLASIVLLCLASSALAGETALPAEVQTALERNARELSPLSIAWTYQSVSPTTPAETLRALGAQVPEEMYFAKWSVRFCWQERKAYRFLDITGAKGYSQQSETVFDGKAVSIGNPLLRMPDGNTRPAIVSKRLVAPIAEKAPKVRYLSADYFESAGLHLPVTAGEQNAGTDAQSTILLLLKSGGRLKEVREVEAGGGKTLLVEILAPNPEQVNAAATDLDRMEQAMRSTGRTAEEEIKRMADVVRKQRELPKTLVYSFRLDPAKGFAVEKRDERYEDGRLLLRVTNGDFRQVPGRELWLPWSSTTENFTAQAEVHDAPVVRDETRVSEVRGDRMPDSQFVLSYTKIGTMIVDDSSGRQVVTTVAPAAPDKDGTRVFYDFEDPEELDGWARKIAADVALSDEHATSGKKSLKVHFKSHVFDWPQVDPVVPVDWSGYSWLVIDVFCEGPMNFMVRIDDDKSRDYASRYNLDGNPLDAGAHSVRIPLDEVAMKIDLRKVHYLSLFGTNIPNDHVFYLDNIRLVKEEPFDPPGPVAPLKTRELKWAKKDGEGALVLYDFEGDEQLAGWQLHKGADVSLSGEHAAHGKRSLKVDLHAGRVGSPLVAPVVPEDWTRRSALEFEVWSDSAMELTVRLTDPESRPGDRHYYQQRFQLRPGENTVTLSLEAVGARIDLAHVTSLTLLRTNIAKDSAFYLDDLRLLE